MGFFARLSYALARSPVLPLFALYLGAGPEAIGFAVGISTVTGIFFKLPSGALSDVIGRKKTMMIGLLFFAFMPFTYLLVKDYTLLIAIRFLHGLATAIYGPVSMAVVADAAGPILVGFLLAHHDYLFSFGVIAAALLLAVPVFIFTVKVSE